MAVHRGFVVAVVLFSATARLSAAPPVLTTIMPRGAERGKPVELVVSGANLTPQTRLILPFKATQKLLPDAKLNPAQVRFQLTVDPSVPIGLYMVRLATEDGVSPFLLFGVDAFPNVTEVEDNSSFEKAQKVSVPVVITGQCAGGDVDFFQFTAKKGQRLIVESECARLGSGVMPQIRVTDVQRRFIAADDTQAIAGDCRASFVAPADGDYVVEFSDSRYRGGNPPDYRLKIAAYDIVEEVFPLGGRRGETVAFTLRGGTLAEEVRIQRTLDDGPDKSIGPTHGTMLLGLDGVVKPGMLSPQVAVGDLPERLWIKTNDKDPKVLDVLPPLTLNSRLEHKGDSDRCQFSVQPGQRFRIAVQAEALGSFLDGVLRVTDQAGKQLALVDDVDVPPTDPGQQPRRTVDPSVELTVPDGTTLLVVELRDQRYRGGINFGYRLTIEPATPDFLVRQPVAELNVPRGGSAALTVPIIRRGYTGAIQLTIPNLPPGFSVQGGHVPADGTGGILTVSAAAQAAMPAEPLLLRIEGRATIEGREVHRSAEEKVVLNPDVNLAAPTVTLSRLAASLTAAEPFGVQGPPALDLVQGYPAMVPVTLTRAKEHAALAVEVTVVAPPLPLVPGQPPAPAGPFTLKPATAAAGSASASITITAGPGAPEGLLDVFVQGKATVSAAEKKVAGPAIPVKVLRSFTVELLTPKLTLSPGQTITLKGRLRRQPVFKEAVAIKLDGLPAGVTLAAPPQPIAAGTNEFQIDLKVDPKATAATANLTLTCSTTIAGIAYPHPALAVPLQLTPTK
jgi:hypothetical protein